MLRHIIRVSLLNELCDCENGLLRDELGNIVDEKEMSALTMVRRVIVPVIAYLVYGRRINKDF
jgi:hypothetical protein